MHHSNNKRRWCDAKTKPRRRFWTPEPLSVKPRFESSTLEHFGTLYYHSESTPANEPESLARSLRRSLRRRLLRALPGTPLGPACLASRLACASKVPLPCDRRDRNVGRRDDCAARSGCSKRTGRRRVPDAVVVAAPSVWRMFRRLLRAFGADRLRTAHFNESLRQIDSTNSSSSGRLASSAARVALISLTCSSNVGS